MPSRPERPEGLALIYDGGVLAGADIAAIRLQADELASYAFVEAARVPELASALLARRITASLAAVAAGAALSLENGRPVS